MRTSKVKGFNLEVLLPDGLINVSFPSGKATPTGKLTLITNNGAVLAFQVKTIDWVERQVKYIESLPDQTIEEVISKLQVLLG